MKRLTIEIDEKLHQQIKAQAYSEAETIKSIVVKLLERWINEPKRKNI